MRWRFPSARRTGRVGAGDFAAGAELSLTEGTARGKQTCGAMAGPSAIV